MVNRAGAPPDVPAAPDPAPSQGGGPPVDVPAPVKPPHPDPPTVKPPHVIPPPRRMDLDAKILITFAPAAFCFLTNERISSGVPVA